MRSFSLPKFSFNFMQEQSCHNLSSTCPDFIHICMFSLSWNRPWGSWNWWLVLQRCHHQHPGDRRQNEFPIPLEYLKTSYCSVTLICSPASSKTRTTLSSAKVSATDNWLRSLLLMLVSSQDLDCVGEPCATSTTSGAFFRRKNQKADISFPLPLTIGLDLESVQWKAMALIKSSAAVFLLWWSFWRRLKGILPSQRLHHGDPDSSSSWQKEWRCMQERNSLSQSDVAGAR